MKNHEEGEIVYCESEQQYMVYQNNSWMPVKAEMTNEGLQLNLYDLNKQIISQLPSLTNNQKEEYIKEINSFKNGDYYMLYGKEISYFTLLKTGTKEEKLESFGKTIFSLLNDLTEKIYSCEKTEDNEAFEIWIEYNDEPTVLYLFNYDNGVVKYYG